MAEGHSGLYSPLVTDRIAGTVVRATIQNRLVSFFATTELDAVMAQHDHGCFYEIEELELIAEHVRPGAVMLDVGANVGNHTLYVALFLDARKVICVEPNRQAAAILRVNVDLNRLNDRVELHLGIGLSDGPGAAVIGATPDMNLGGVALTRQEGGPIPLVGGDDQLAGEQVEFIKIDVEGMELDVLRGLQRTIETCRPVMLVEVDETTAADFHALTAQWGYAVAGRVDYGYDGVENLLIVPVERREASR